jgi:hypothetical protein
MPTPKGEPDPTVIIPAQDLATLQNAPEARLADILAVVGEDSPCRRRHLPKAGRIAGAVNTVLTEIGKALPEFLRPPEPGRRNGPPARKPRPARRNGPPAAPPASDQGAA